MRPKITSGSSSGTGECVHAARLLVVGCKGSGSLKVPVGSVARDVLTDMPCPTLITRPAPEHESASP